jgi:hypothetical protein
MTAAAVDEYGFLVPSSELKPGQKYAPGDRVVSRWGNATIIHAYERPYFDSPRSYLILHDWSDAPPGFGHHFGENELAPGRPHEVIEADEPSGPTPVAIPQLELFA